MVKRQKQHQQRRKKCRIIILSECCTSADDQLTDQGTGVQGASDNNVQCTVCWQSSEFNVTMAKYKVVSAQGD